MISGAHALIISNISEGDLLFTDFPLLSFSVVGEQQFSAVVSVVAISLKKKSR